MSVRSFNTAVALTTSQFIQVRCPSSAYWKGELLPGALQTCNKWAVGTCAASPQFWSRDYGQVQSTVSHFVFLCMCSASMLHPCMHWMQEYKCVCVLCSVPPPAPLWREGGSRTATTHSLRLCTNSKSDLRQALTRFLSTLNKTPITALLNTVTGFHRFPWIVAWQMCVWTCLYVYVCWREGRVHVCLCPCV